MSSLLLAILFQINSAIAYWLYESLNVTQWQWQSCTSSSISDPCAQVTEPRIQLLWSMTGYISTVASCMRRRMERILFSTVSRVIFLFSPLTQTLRRQWDKQFRLICRNRGRILPFKRTPLTLSARSLTVTGPNGPLSFTIRPVTR